MPAIFNCVAAPELAQWLVTYRHQTGTLGSFMTTNHELRQLCMLLDLKHSAGGTIETAEFNVLALKIYNHIRSTESRSEFLQSCAKLLYLLGVAAALNAPIIWQEVE